MSCWSWKQANLNYGTNWQFVQGEGKAISRKHMDYGYGLGLRAYCTVKQVPGNNFRMYFPRVPFCYFGIEGHEMQSQWKESSEFKLGLARTAFVGSGLAENALRESRVECLHAISVNLVERWAANHGRAGIRCCPTCCCIPNLRHRACTIAPTELWVVQSKVRRKSPTRSTLRWCCQGLSSRVHFSPSLSPSTMVAWLRKPGKPGMEWTWAHNSVSESLESTAVAHHQPRTVVLTWVLCPSLHCIGPLSSSVNQSINHIMAIAGSSWLTFHLVLS